VHDELYTRFLLSSLLVLITFRMQFPSHVYPGMQEQREGTRTCFDKDPSMENKLPLFIYLLLFGGGGGGALYIIKEIGRVPSISDSRSLDDMPIRVAKCISLYISEAIRVTELVLTLNCTIGLNYIARYSTVPYHGLALKLII